VLEDNSDNLWIGTANESLFRYNLKLKKLEEYSYKTVMPKAWGEVS